MEEATVLTKFGSSVTVVHRRDTLRASRIMVDRAEANPKISWAWNSAVVDIHGEGTVTGVRLRDTVTGDERDLAVGGLFIAIGHLPRSELVKGQLDLDDEGYVLTTEGTHTNLEGVFAAGDVVDHVYRQAVTAAASGCQAALDAERFLAHRAHDVQQAQLAQQSS
jgi:thioredoxin reductase (NADPH)